jgi:hypothetical protein
MFGMKDNYYTAPVILIIFNRPDLTTKVFEAIRQASPANLLIIADGPRPTISTDYANCMLARSIVEQVDWDCEVKRNYSDINLGCKHRVASGLDWAFEIVEEAIILEDDCLPHSEFFRFCSDLLAYYRHDERIMHISGNNFFGSQYCPNHSYYFSHFNHIWGWASWRRAWVKYDVEMAFWPKVKNTRFLHSVLPTNSGSEYWTSQFQAVYDQKIDTWDYAWTFACWLNHGLSILPKSNLVSNIGFDERATHTKDTRSPVSNMVANSIEFPLVHPDYMICNTEADLLAQKKLFQTSNTSFVAKIGSVIKSQVIKS